MINRSEPSGPEVKTCKYQVDGEDCGIPFERPHNMHIGNWEQSTRCPKHKRMSGQKQPKGPRLGQYEVKNPIIDAFLMGRL